MNTFSPGDRALVVGKRKDCRPDLHRYLGQTVTVTGTLDMPRELWHTVRAEDGHTFAARPEALQKLPPQPPREQTTSWDRCVWRPADAKVVL